MTSMPIRHLIILIGNSYVIGTLVHYQMLVAVGAFALAELVLFAVVQAKTDTI